MINNDTKQIVILFHTEEGGSIFHRTLVNRNYRTPSFKSGNTTNNPEKNETEGKEYNSTHS